MSFICHHSSAIPSSKTLLAAAMGLLSLSACASSEKIPQEAKLLNFKHSDIQHSYFDGKSNDLLSAGLGFQGLQNPKQPGLENPDNISEEDLRRAAIYNNYRAIVSTNSDAGFGRLYGPSAQQKPIAGHEYSSSIHYSDGELAANIVVQIPDSFNPQKPCIIAAPSSGSRGVWGAIGTAGDWGLRHSCAVAYTDKGTGTGFQFLDNGDNYKSNGLLSGGQATVFDPKDLRIASKHAHSGKHVEKDWGRFTLQAVQMAFYLLNQHHRDDSKRYFTKPNTNVIAASISNGGNSVIQAAELDKSDWIDAVVASEPTLNVPSDFKFEVQHEQDSYRGTAKDILYVGIQHALYQPCALLATKSNESSLFHSASQLAHAALNKRCENLKSAGLIKDNENLANAAREQLEKTGMLSPSYSLQAFAVVNQLWPSIAINYANAYGARDVKDDLCGFSFVYQQAGKAMAMPKAARQALYGLSSGIPNTGGVSLAYKGLPLNIFDPNDSSFEGFQCLAKFYQDKQLQNNLKSLALSGDIDKKPAIIIHGSHDSLVGPNHNARAYMVLRAKRFPDRDNVRYIEIDNGQHFDALLSFPEFRQDLVPMHVYFERALDAMWQHLQHGNALPAHQRVHSKGQLKLEAKGVPNFSQTSNIDISADRIKL
ncbi:3-hydroxybutyrate oligomer hydrolase family protein [uncultured Pseudoteredinibacter sp.]|uniref:3-hydroxybutyrate oligomer hydrolase family protein n=1 Tax=uncultured Pseudoteredinibacter sp. TaxID=1641701 RepID=UPI002622F900|nr:3-hydroxybutyrate oligomer hydrolase family protein [uncultured Pseudoteredinibacter sp.]